MDIIYPLVSDLFYVLLCRFFTGSVARKEEDRVITAGKLLIMAFWFTATVALTSLLSENMMIKILCLILSSSLFTSLIAQEFSFRTIAAVTMYHALGFLADLCAWTAAAAMDPGIGINLMTSEMTVVTAALMSYLVQFMCTMFIRRYICRKEIDIISGSEWIRVVIFPVATMFIMFAIVYGTYRNMTREVFMIMYGVAVIILFLNIYAFHTMIYVTAKDRQIKEAQAKLAGAAKQIRLYSKIGDELKTRTRLAHEYRNNLNLIKACVKSSEYDKLQSIVSEFCSELDDSIDVIDTHNTAADVILNTRYSEGRRHGIVFILTLDDLSDIPLSAPEMTTLLANLTDNAVEACKKCEDAHKIVRIGFVNDKDALIVSVSNTYDGRLRTSGGKLLTTKEDDSLHGCGMENISFIVNKHGGTDAVSYDDREFCHTVRIPRTSGARS